MIPQVDDFKSESLALFDLLADVDPNTFSEATQFKNWTINSVLQHLHFWNIMANLSLMDESAFLQTMKEMQNLGIGMRGFENHYLQGLEGTELLEAWQQELMAVANNFATANPKTRVKWGGPDMSARSSITARLMETWAHGQEVYDHLGVERVNSDRIKNIAHLGVITYGFTYAIRERKAPENAPYVKLTAPSGEIWEWNTADASNMVEGDATDFCQVVTQSRNIADTKLRATGETAKEWMSIAQCFAGGAQQPPAAGTRFTRTANN